MTALPLLRRILCDEALTRRLGDAEARVLVEWLVERAERLARVAPADAEKEVSRLCRRGRGIARFVSLWCLEDDRRGAAQLAASEGFRWPLPPPGRGACDLMQDIVAFEDAWRGAG
jgi:hypothetical protein